MPLAGTSTRTLAAVLIATAVLAGVFSLLGTPPPSEQGFLWWTARASGLTAYLLLAASMVFGLLVSWRGLAGAIGQKRAFGLHDQASLAALAASSLHVLAVGGVVLSGERGWSLLAPLAAAFGALALGGLAFLFSMRYLTRRLSVERWRVVHRLAFLVYVFALGHAATAGAGDIDTHVRWLYLLLGGLIIGASVFRATFHAHGGAGRAAPAAAGAQVEAAIEAARRGGGELLLVLVQARSAEALDAEAVALAVRRAGGGRSEAFQVEPTMVGVLRAGRDLRAAEPSLVEGIRAACDAEVSAGYAVYPVDAWDADGLRRAALMRLLTDLYGLDVPGDKAPAPLRASRQPREAA